MAILKQTMILALGLVLFSHPAYAKSSEHQQTAYIILNHKVNNFASWIKEYKKHQDGHKKNALKDVAMYQSIADPNDVTIIFKTNDVAKAKGFLEGPHSDEMYKSAGVVGKPMIIFTHKLKDKVYR